MLKRQIPNFFTLLNLFSGIIAIIMALSDNLEYAAYFVFLGVFFDFFDGFFARKFNVQGELGKQLDSLADMVTSGVVPGLVMFQLLTYASKSKWFMELTFDQRNWQNFGETSIYYLPFLGLIIPLAAAYRLANFNIDERQSNSFIGLPTPALSIFVVSIPLILKYSEFTLFVNLFQSNWVLVSITIFGSYLLNAEVPLFSLKFKDYQWNNNQIKYVFLLVSLVLLILFKLVAISIIIVVYVLISIVNNLLHKKKTASS